MKSRGNEYTCSVPDTSGFAASDPEAGVSTGVHGGDTAAPPPRASPLGLRCWNE